MRLFVLQRSGRDRKGLERRKKEREEIGRERWCVERREQKRGEKVRSGGDDEKKKEMPRLIT
jgi:hypothetical protein